MECVKNAKSIYQDENQKYFVKNTPNNLEMLKEPVGDVNKVYQLSLNEESKKRRKEVEVGVIITLKMRNVLKKILF